MDDKQVRAKESFSNIVSVWFTIGSSLQPRLMFRITRLPPDYLTTSLFSKKPIGNVFYDSQLAQKRPVPRNRGWISNSKKMVSIH